MSLLANVVATKGQVFLIGLDGQPRPAKAGETIRMGQVVLTGADGSLELEMADGQTLKVGPEQSVTIEDGLTQNTRPEKTDASLAQGSIDQVIKAIEAGGDLDNLDATAAGLGSGGANDGSNFVRLLRITETVDPLSYQFATERQGVDSVFDGGGLPTASPLTLQVFVVVDGPATEGAQFVAGVGWVAPLGQLSEGQVGVYVVFAVNGNGTVIPGIGGTVDITFVDGTATTGVDYVGGTLTGIVVGQPFTNATLDDFLADDGETFSVVASNYDAANFYSSVAYVPAGVVITDNSGNTPEPNPNDPDGPGGPGPEDTVYAVISVDKASVAEGGELTYTVQLVDKDNNPVTVPAGSSVTVTLDWSKSEAQPDDFTAPLPTSVVIAGGTSQTEFTIHTQDDYLAEGTESVVVEATTIVDTNNVFEATQVGDVNGNGKEANSAIVDNADAPEPNPNDPDGPGGPGPEDTVYAVISVDKSSVAEGGELTYTVQLVDKDNNPVTVPAGSSVTVTLDWSKSEAQPDDFTAPRPTSVVIAGGTSQTEFTIHTQDDYLAEGTESVVVEATAIVDTNNVFEATQVGDVNGNGKEANSAIVDNADAPEPNPTDPNGPGGPGPEDTVYAVISVDKSSVAEGGELTYTVQLVDKDNNPVTVPAGSSITVNLGWSGVANTASDVALNQLPSSVTLSSGSSVSFTVTTLDDVYREPDEDLVATLTGVVDTQGVFEAIQAGASNGTGLDAHTVVVDDFDPTTLTLTATGTDLLASSGGTTVFTVSVDHPPQTPLTVTLSNGATLTIGVGQTTGSVSVVYGPNANPTPVTIDLNATSGGNYESLEAQGSVTFVIDAAPTLGNGTAHVSEEGLALGIPDDGPTGLDTTNEVTYTGSLALTNDGDALTVGIDIASLPGGASSITSGGAPVAWAYGASEAIVIGSANGQPVITITVNNGSTAVGGGATSVAYGVELHAPVDHPDTTQEDVLTFVTQVLVSDGKNTPTTGQIFINIEDDSPTTTMPDPLVIEVPVSTVNVSGLIAGFDNWTLTNGAGGFQSINNDSDAFADALQWGYETSVKSGYSFVDNNDLRDATTANLLDSTFRLGTFTHDNFPIPSVSTLPESVDLVVQFNLVIDGEVITITHTVTLLHNETPNTNPVVSSPENDDIITLADSSLVQTFTVGARTFEFEISGFRDAAGNLVTQINTTENQANTFELFATIRSTDDLPTVSGPAVSTQSGADTPDALVWLDDAGNTLAYNASGVASFTHAFGTFEGYADGSYSFQLSREARDDLDVDETRTLDFTYRVTDADGDSVLGQASVILQGVPNEAGAIGGRFAAFDEVDSSDGLAGALGVEAFRFELAETAAPNAPDAPDAPEQTQSAVNPADLLGNTADHTLDALLPGGTTPAASPAGASMDPQALLLDMNSHPATIRQEENTAP